MPTTSGTGSEVTRLGDGLGPRGRQEVLAAPAARRGPKPRSSIPELTLSLPAGPTLAAGLDALSHALESIWNVNANPVSDNHAVNAARAVLATLPRADAETSATSSCAAGWRCAALTAGLAFSNTRTALAHSISYDMTIHHGLPHGIACSFTLPLVLERALGADAGRDAVLARVFDGDARRRAGASSTAFPRAARRQHALRELRRVGGRIRSA